MSLRRAMDHELQRAFGARTDDYFDIAFGQRPPHYQFSTQRDLDVLVWSATHGVLRPDIDAAALRRSVNDLKRQLLAHIFPPGAALLAMFVDCERPQPPPVPHEMEDVTHRDWLGPLSQAVFTFARLTADAADVTGWLAARDFTGNFIDLIRPILVSLDRNTLTVYSTEPATLTEIEQLLAPKVAAVRARFAPG